MATYKRTLRLAALVLVGAVVSIVLFTDIFVGLLYIYDHGFGETAKSALVAGAIGAIAGLGLEGLLRSRKPSNK